MDQLSQVNVVVALDRIRTLLGPERCERLDLVGLFFRIDDGTVWVLRDEEFVPLADGELRELAHLNTPERVEYRSSRDDNRTVTRLA